MSKKVIYIVLGLLVATYLYLTFGLPPDPRSLAFYKISVAKSRLLSATVAVPAIIIWTLAFYGFATFKQYAQSIKKSADGKGLNTISNGLMVLALSLPLSSILSASLNYYVRSHPTFKQSSVFITSYFTIVVYLIAFGFIVKGTRALLAVSKSKISIVDQMLPLFGLLTTGALYTYLTLKNSWSSPAVPISLVHFLSTPIVVLTVILPYLLIWFTGLLAVANMSLYRQTVHGHIYKKALTNLTGGIGLVIITSILVQFLTSLGGNLLKMSLNQLLLLIYGLLVIIAAGYVMIAFGAKKLRKIEEV